VGKGEGASPDAKENKDVEARAAELIADVFMNFLLSMVWVFCLESFPVYKCKVNSTRVE